MPPRKSSLVQARNELHQYTDKQKAKTARNFFKNCKSDIFLGVNVPTIRKIAKNYKELSLKDLRLLMKSDVHDERTLAHAILRLKFENTNDIEQTKLYQFYIKHHKSIRDWDGVDDSAPYIVGVYLLTRDKKILYQLAKSKHLWSRRIAIVSTWWFIRNDRYHDTLKLSKILIQDKEDLIHKATGWMLREVGKRDVAALRKFLDLYYQTMPRTMLRYAIERLNLREKAHYMEKVST